MQFKLFIYCLAATLVVVFRGGAWGQDFFKGKVIQILVGYPTGGGVDAEGRMLAKYLERHLPGNPAVTVRNMPPLLTKTEKSKADSSSRSLS